MNRHEHSEDTPERRRRTRQPSRAAAWADPGGVLPVIDCRILDLTDQGARVAEPKGVELPQMFQLQIDSTRILGAAEVVWRANGQVGVRFLERLPA